LSGYISSNKQAYHLKLFVDSLWFAGLVIRSNMCLFSFRSFGLIRRSVCLLHSHILLGGGRGCDNSLPFRLLAYEVDEGGEREGGDICGYNNCCFFGVEDDDDGSVASQEREGRRVRGKRGAAA